MALDPWTGLIDPKAALAARRAAARTLASSSQGCRLIGESENLISSKSYHNSSHSSHSSQGARLLSPTSHSAAKDREITCSSSLSDTYDDLAVPLGLPDPGFERLDDSAPAKVAKRLEYGSTHYDRSTIALATPAKVFSVVNKVPSPIAHLSGPQGWRDGLARLDRLEAPCPGFRFGEWDALHRVISHFMDQCANEAQARGWTALDLFGVHRTAGGAWVDSCGALMLPLLKSASAISADAISFGPLVYRRRSMPEAVLVWDFVGEAA